MKTQITIILLSITLAISYCISAPIIRDREATQRFLDRTWVEFVEIQRNK